MLRPVSWVFRGNRGLPITGGQPVVRRRAVLRGQHSTACPFGFMLACLPFMPDRARISSRTPTTTSSRASASPSARSVSCRQMQLVPNEAILRSALVRNPLLRPCQQAPRLPLRRPHRLCFHDHWEVTEALPHLFPTLQLPLPPVLLMSRAAPLLTHMCLNASRDSRPLTAVYRIAIFVGRYPFLFLTTVRLAATTSATLATPASLAPNRRLARRQRLLP